MPAITSVSTAKKLKLLSIFAAIILSGCSTPKDFYATGGSRADGTIDMAYDFAQFEKPVVSIPQALSIAKSKCGVWGYSNAESFGGKTTNCQQRDGFGNCVAGQVVIKYQCIGDIGSPALKSPAALAAPVSTSAGSPMGKVQLSAAISPNHGAAIIL